ncbi:interleukin-10-like [Megalops cyprinoides]|uniref:interleukin-10-like n=1 Tax=Megalops cyprinoides TaxID=118141 RepID=UPI0018645A21|nr:interleukin-10-like [Megalops cyprinoides]
MSVCVCSVSACLLLALLFGGACCAAAACRNRCCAFVENFPPRLKDLRTSFHKMKDYYEDKDQIETALLDSSVLLEIQSPYGCRAMNDILHFYLDTVLPAAKNASDDFKPHIANIGTIFYELKRELLYCKDYFSCKKPFELESIIDAYNKMQEQGLYKAMGELDLLFNYIEEYMVSKRRPH